MESRREKSRMEMEEVVSKVECCVALGGKEGKEKQTGPLARKSKPSIESTTATIIYILYTQRH